MRKVIPTGSDEVLSVEVKDPKRPEYGTITMVFIRDGFAPAGLRLRGWVALDSQNNRTRIDLSNQKFNVAVADSAFKAAAVIIIGIACSNIAAASITAL